MLKVLASKRKHNFSPHLSRDLTLPGNTLITEYARCIPSSMRKNLLNDIFILTSQRRENTSFSIIQINCKVYGM